jgi:hypothetical protein
MQKKDIDINTFEGGMNTDISPEMYQKNTAAYIQNFRAVNDAVNTTLILRNFKGNELSATLPTVNSVWKLVPKESGPFPWVNTTITIETETNTYSTNLLATPNGDELFLIEQIYNTLSTNPIFSPLNLKLSKGTGVVYIYSETENIVSISPGSVYQDWFKVVDKVENFKILGSTDLRDDVVLFTTGGDGTLQLWRIAIDKENEVIDSVDLRYHNSANVSQDYPIEALSRHENSKVQSIYWTDNNNPLRKLNITLDENFFLEVTQLEIQPLIKFNPPILQEISGGGSLESGKYYIAYRYKNANGVETRFSPLSQGINITESIEQPLTGSNTVKAIRFQDYQGSTGTANKSIRFNIEGLDTTYDFIEYAAIYVGGTNLIPEIHVFAEDPNNQPNVTKIFTGNENLNLPITLEEFTAIQGAFDICKSLEAKDNILFAANVKSSLIEVPDSVFDARAYRFDSTQNVQLISESGQVTINIDGNSPDWDSVPEEHDAINPYNYENYDPTATPTHYKYQADGVTLGGEGKFIKYGFVKTPLLSDRDFTQPDNRPFVRNDNPTGYGVGDEYTQAVSTSLTNQVYPHNNHAYNIRSPYTAQVFTGYSRGEVYRFGIVFINPQGRKSFVKWIGDIKFPDFNEGGVSNGAGQLYGTSGDNLFSYQLGLSLEVTLPPALEGWSYQIVRVERKEEDKTRFGNGLYSRFLRARYVGLNDEALIIDVNNIATYGISIEGGSRENIWLLNRGLEYSDANSGADSYRFGHIKHPNALFGKYQHKQGDVIRNVGGYKFGDNFSRDYTPFVFFRDRYTKFYQPYTIPPNPNSVQITQFIQMDRGDYLNANVLDGNVSGGSKVANVHPKTKNTLLGLRHRISGIGKRIHLVNHNTGKIGEGNFSNSRDIANLCSIERYVSGQYGGITHSARTTNEYIGTGNFVKHNPGSVSFFVYGGDTFVDAFSFFLFSRFTDTGFENVNGVDLADVYEQDNDLHQGLAQVFVGESAVNHGLRNGKHWARNYDKDNIAGDGPNNISYQEETYSYNNAYSTENTIVKYFPKAIIQNTEQEYDARIHYSLPKINGEENDNWTVFQAANYVDVDYRYGPINKILKFNDKFLFFQDRAVGALDVNERSLIADNIGELVLGSGGIENYQYITENGGCKHQWSVVASTHNVLWFDVLNKTIWKLGEGKEALSTSKFVRGLLNDITEGELKIVNNSLPRDIGDNPLLHSGVHSVANPRHHELWITFKNKINGKYKYTTLIYNEFLNNFSGVYTIDSIHYATNKNNIISLHTDNQNDLYIHDKGEFGKFFGTYYDSIIDNVSNKHPQFTKVYDNHEVKTVCKDSTGGDLVETFNHVHCRNDHQESDLQLLPQDTVKRSEREWRLFVPKSIKQNSNLKARMRDNYLISRFTYNNNLNKEFIVKFIKTLFRVSSH